MSCLNSETRIYSYLNLCVVQVIVLIIRYQQTERLFTILETGTVLTN